MSQSVKEFVRRSGVEVQSPNSNSNSNDEYARELEEEMLKAEREQARPTYKAFRTPPRQVRPPPRARVPERLQKNLISEPLVNEFADINENAFVKALAEANFTEFNTQLEISKLNPGMFNATVDSGFGPKDVVVDIKKILMKPPLGKIPIGEGLYLDTQEIRGVYGQFKTGFTHTKDFGPKGNIGKPFSTVQFKLEISNGVESKGVTVNIYKNGKIRFSGGFVGTNIANQPELIRRFIVDRYTDKQPFFYNPFVYNNLNGQFRINGVFKNMEVIGRRSQQYGMTSYSYEPELSPFFYAYFDDTKLILSKSGNVQITGAKNPTDMLRSYDFAKRFVQSLNTNGHIVVKGAFSEGVKASKPKAKPKPSKKTKMNLTNFDPKKCERMDKKELMDMAKRVGVVNFRVKTNAGGSRMAKKSEICKKIKDMIGKKNVTYNKNKKLTGSGNTFKVGSILCKNQSVKELLRVAAILKISLTGNEKKADLCKLIEKARNNIRTAPSPVRKPAPTKREIREVAANKKRNTEKAAVMKKRGLDENSIRKNISNLYGDKWMKRYKPNLNQDVRNMKAALNAINAKNKKFALPFKKDVKAVEKTVVNQWKMQRKRDLEKKYIMNTVNVTGVPLNMRNAWRRAAANEAANRSKLMTNKQLAIFKKGWLKRRANLNTNGNARRPIAAARARIEKI